MIAHVLFYRIAIITYLCYLCSVRRRSTRTISHVSKNLIFSTKLLGMNIIIFFSSGSEYGSEGLFRCEICMLLQSF